MSPQAAEAYNLMRTRMSETCKMCGPSLSLTNRRVPGAPFLAHVARSGAFRQHPTNPQPGAGLGVGCVCMTIQKALPSPASVACTAFPFSGIEEVVEIESQWTAQRREQLGVPPQLMRQDQSPRPVPAQDAGTRACPERSRKDGAAATRIMVERLGQPPPVGGVYPH